MCCAATTQPPCNLRSPQGQVGGLVLPSQANAPQPLRQEHLPPAKPPLEVRLTFPGARKRKPFREPLLFIQGLRGRRCMWSSSQDPLCGGPLAHVQQWAACRGLTDPSASCGGETLELGFECGSAALAGPPGSTCTRTATHPEVVESQKVGTKEAEAPCWGPVANGQVAPLWGCPGTGVGHVREGLGRPHMQAADGRTGGPGREGQERWVTQAPGAHSICSTR